MNNSNLDHLKDVAQAASADLSQQKKIEHLSQAFDLFTKESERLEKSYADLKNQFIEINLELQATVEELKRKLLELDAITYYLNSILSNISQGIIFINLNGDITTYNEAAQHILQIPSQKILFHPFWDNFTDDFFGFSMRESLGLQHPMGTTYASFKANASTVKELEVETSFVLHHPQKTGQITDGMQGMIVIFKDITEIRRLQSIANRNDRLKELGEMAAMVAHEIRNPLGGIKGFASLLFRDLENHPHLQQMAKYIMDGTENLNKLVTTILNYARPLQMHIELADLLPIMQDLKEFIQADDNVRDKIKVDLQTKYNQLFAPIDPSLLKSALLNLVVNAIQAMPEGGNLTLTLDEANGCAIVKIQDTGIGIAPENIPKLYSPFFTTRTDGNGFGLAEVLKIVQAHGATIEVRSEINKGTEFTIKIPERVKG